MLIFSGKPVSTIVSLSLVAILAACDTTPYEELSATETVSGTFSNALASGYKDFAKSEIDQYDWPDQHYIATKGLKAAKGGWPLPENPADWGVEQTDHQAFSAPRADLIHWLNTDARALQPTRAAKAQVSFDCWVEQKEENWQLDHIKSCREDMAHALPKMTQIHFAFNSATLDASHLHDLQKISMNWRNDPGEFILLQGHTDQIGSKEYNYKLSKHRVLSVRKSLISFGVPEEAIQTQVWGKTRQRPEFSNVASSPKNRRVEILSFRKNDS